MTGGANPPPVSEAELHAFADGQLAPARQAQVQAFLDQHPAQAGQVADWQAQNLALRQLLDPVLEEPLPLRLPLAPEAPPLARAWRWQALAAGVAMLLVGGGSAWFARGWYERHGLGDTLAAASPPSLSGFARRAAVAHVVYSPDARRPVELGADQEQALVAWLSKRLGSAVQVPDLQPLGYGLLGGRLLPGDHAPVAQFMYGRADGERLTLYLTREESGRETAFRFGQEGTVNVFYWVDRDFGYAISAGESRQELARVAQAVYRQLGAKR